MNSLLSLSKAALATILALAAAACATSGHAQQAEADKRLEAAHLATFDDLDYNVFTGQKWAELHRSHAHDIKVTWPDGHSTVGIDRHVEDLKAMFVWAPDTRIKEHPVKIARGQWTAVIGVIEGTFSQPMPLGEGKSLPPTGKAYKLQMATIGHWNSDGVMDEEYLFWDNKELLRQLGLGN